MNWHFPDTETYKIYDYYPEYQRSLKVANTYYTLNLAALDLEMIHRNNPNLDESLEEMIGTNTYCNSYDEYFFSLPERAADQHSRACALHHQMRLIKQIAEEGLGLVCEVHVAIPLIREFIQKRSHAARRKITALYGDCEDSEEVINEIYRTNFELVKEFAAEYGIKLPAIDWDNGRFRL